MEIHWRNPNEMEPADRGSVEEKLRALAHGHTDLIDIWIDLGDEAHHRHGTEHATVRAQVRRADLIARGHDLSMELALRNALQTFERELRQLRERRADHTPDLGTGPPLRGVIDRVFPKEDHGFLISEAGERVYFHRNSLRGGFDLNTLQEGESVSFNIEAGDDGAQATVVLPPPPGAV